jgi:hypothetical protein
LTEAPPCEQCGERACGFDDDGFAICEDCALETYGDLETMLRIVMREPVRTRT